MADRLLDHNGRLVHQFEIRMHNLGFQRMAEEIVAMLDSGAWQDWKDGMGRVQLLPGEFDYFLSTVGITRADVMAGIRDMTLKARIAEAMDERRNKDPDYRRPYDQVQTALGRRTAEPFGFTQSEAKVLVNGHASQTSAKHRLALGDAVRRYQNTGDATAKAKKASRVEQLERAIERLDQADFDELAEWFTDYRRTRRKRRG